MKYKFRFLLSCLLIVIFSTTVSAQKLKAGFDKYEFLEMLRITARHVDVSAFKDVPPPPEKFKMIYRSANVGLDNRWDLWLSNDSIAVISIRGTTSSNISWLENFYTAMIPASGQIKFFDNFNFDYHLADNPKAGIHSGWLIGTAFLSRDILPKIDSCYKNGIKDFIILGHSQGGAITYLITSYLLDQKRENHIPADVHFKTYCSAAPKPGNLYYAYDYEVATAGGWAFNVVNTADWVPECPTSIQTLEDFNTTNPFRDVKKTIRKQPFFQRLLFKHVYNKLERPARKAQKNYARYLGRYAAKLVAKQLKAFSSPQFLKSANYTRAGNFIILKADADYYSVYPEKSDQVFIHHFIGPYYYLTIKLP